MLSKKREIKPSGIFANVLHSWDMISNSICE